MWKSIIRAKNGVCVAVLAGAILAARAALGAEPASGEEQVFQPIGVGGGGAILAPSVSPYDPNFMLISTDMGGCYRSSDGGKTWAMMHFTQLSGAAGATLSLRALILKDEIYWQGTPIWQSPILKVSRDKGKTWTAPAEKYPWQPKAIRRLAAIESPSLVLLTGNENGFWRSLDKGKTWEALTPEGTDGKNCTAIVALDDRVLATLGSKLVESRDQGKTWKDLPIEVAKGKALLSAAGGQDKGKATVLYVIADGVGTLQSTDDGKTWAVAQPWNQQTDVQMAVNQTQIAFTAQSDGAGREAFATYDAGKTWKSVFPPQEPQSKLDWTQIEMKWDYRIMNAGLCVSRTDPKLIMVSSIGDAYVSRDAGKSWVPLTTADASLPAQAGNPYKRWKTNGLQVTGCYSFHVDPNDPKRHFAGHSDIGLLRSIDGGESWSTLSYRGSPWVNSYYQLAFDPFVKNRIYAAASNTHDIPDWRLIDDLPKQTGGVIVSDDGGDTWKKLWALEPEKVITSICVDAKASKGKDGVVLYAAAYDDGVYKSTDSGKTWTRKSKGLGREGNLRVHRVQVHPESGNVYAVTIGRKHGMEFRVPGGLWKSTDGGDTWTDLTAELKLMWPAGYFSIHPKDEKIILLSASGGPGCMEQGGVWKTPDGGKTWKHTLTAATAGKYSPPAEAIQSWDVRFNTADPSLVYFGTVFQGLWYSRDGGDSWNPFTEFPYGSAHSAQTDPLDPKKIIVSTFGGGLWRGPCLPPKEMK